MNNPKEEMLIYEWVDSANLSRPKRNINQDFSDGVLMAELLKTHLPNMVDVHNYITTNNKQQKRANWILLNKKVFSKIGYRMTEDEIDNIITSRKNYIEALLKSLYYILKTYKDKKKKRSTTPSYRRMMKSTSPIKKVEMKIKYSKKEVEEIEERYKVILNEKESENQSLRKKIKELERSIEKNGKVIKKL